MSQVNKNYQKINLVFARASKHKQSASKQSKAKKLSDGFCPVGPKYKKTKREKGKKGLSNNMEYGNSLSILQEALLLSLCLKKGQD